MKRLLLLPLLLPFCLKAQSVQWLRQAGTTGIARQSATDAGGNVYVAGGVSDSARFDHLISGAHFADAFIAKYDSLGHVIWARTGGGNLIDEAYDIVTDVQGNSFITGDYATNLINPTVQFGTQVVTGAGNYDGFVARYDSSGNLVWIRTMKSKLGDGSRGIARDAAGNIYTCGFFSDTATFDQISVVSAGFNDLFVAKYNAAGTVQWVRTAGGSGSEIAQNITLDGAGHIAITGAFQQTAVFGAQTLTAAGLQDIFVTLLDTAGNFVWARRAGSSTAVNGDHGMDIGADAQGNFYVTGSFARTAAFGNLTVTPHTDTNYADIFIAKYDPNGNALWVRHAGENHNDESYGIAVDAAGNSYITGFPDSGPNIRFDNLSIPPVGAEVVFLAKYNTQGTIQWVRGYAPGRGQGIFLAGNKRLYLTGNASAIPNVTLFDTVVMQYNDRNAFIASVVDTGTATPPPTAISGAALPQATIYPNPASESLYISTDNPGACSYRITDAGGTFLAGGILAETHNRISIAAYPAGCYFLTVTDRSGGKKGYKIIRE